MLERLFQSTPPVAGGRCPTASAAHQRRHVSIHAPRCRGAMRAGEPHGWYSIQCFNPRPPLPGGDAFLPVPRMARLASFNPRPPLPGGDAYSSYFFPPFAAVSIHAPRCRGAMHGRSGFQGDGRQSSFNPRPPLPGGDAIDAAVIKIEGLVSIHAPRCRGAMPRKTTRKLWGEDVSIHAPRCRGAMPRRSPRRLTKIPGFQSTPPVAGGRCLCSTAPRYHQR